MSGLSIMSIHRLAPFVAFSIIAVNFDGSCGFSASPHLESRGVPSSLDPIAILNPSRSGLHGNLRACSESESVVDRRSILVGSASAAVAVASAGPALAATSNEIPTWTLDGGVQMPVLALNTVGLSVQDTERAVALARQSGITHIDFHPGTERDGVARYLRKGRRSDLFLNTKVRKAPPGTSPQDAAERTRIQIEQDLQALGLASVDMLMLRDSPDSAVIQAQWAVLEDALAKGQTRSVGVINFCEFSLKSVLETAKVRPAVNYIM